MKYSNDLDEARNIQYQIVLDSWNKLINDLTVYFPLARDSGGTLGHRIGSILAKQKELIKIFR